MDLIKTLLKDFNLRKRLSQSATIVMPMPIIYLFVKLNAIIICQIKPWFAFSIAHYNIFCVDYFIKYFPTIEIRKQLKQTVNQNINSCFVIAGFLVPRKVNQ
ncbi:MAG TPA: hypothetical protein PKW17_06195 [Smithellaceae bacterium]|nr:hypothetical protein [Smithellaceae bacterium]HRS89414.1 hypothetical protein [Smithellaceae bacterium]